MKHVSPALIMAISATNAIPPLPAVVVVVLAHYRFAPRLWYSDDHDDDDCNHHYRHYHYHYQNTCCYCSRSC